MLKLKITEPGTLFSRLLEREITPDQYATITKIIEEPDAWLLINRDQLLGVQQKRVGFGPPAGGENQNAR